MRSLTATSGAETECATERQRCFHDATAGTRHAGITPTTINATMHRIIVALHTSAIHGAICVAAMHGPINRAPRQRIGGARLPIVHIKLRGGSAGGGRMWAVGQFEYSLKRHA